MKFDELHHAGGCVAHDRRGLIRVVLLVIEVAIDLLHAEPSQRGQRALDVRVQRGQRSRESYLGRGDVGDKRVVLPVKDLAAGGGNRRYPQRVRLHHLHRRFVINDLEEKESHDQRDQKDEEEPADHQPAPLPGRALTSSGEAMRSRIPTGLGSLIVRPRPRNGCNETHGRHRRENHEPIRRSRHEPLIDANSRTIRPTERGASSAERGGRTRRRSRPWPPTGCLATTKSSR